MTRFAPAIDPASPTPPFRQLHSAVVSAVADGTLAPGARLPTVRALAAELELAANTVASAYRSLEAAGIVEGRGRAGTFVAAGDDPVAAAAQSVAREAATQLHALGVTRDQAAALVTAGYADLAER